MSFQDKLKKTSKIDLINLLISSQDDVFNIIDQLEQSANANIKDAENVIEAKLDEIINDESLSLEDKNELTMWLCDDLVFPKHGLELAQEIQIIALNAKLEIYINRLCKFSGMFDKTTHKIDELIGLFQKNNIDITKLNGFNEFRELRYLNNCIKHEGYVNSQLKNVNGWTEKFKIKPEECSLTYKRIKQPISQFIKEIGYSIISEMKNREENV